MATELNQYVWNFWIAPRMHPCRVIQIATSLEEARIIITNTYDIKKESWNICAGPQTGLMHPDTYFAVGDREFATVLNVVLQTKPSKILPLSATILMSALDC